MGRQQRIRIDQEKSVEMVINVLHGKVCGTHCTCTVGISSLGAILTPWIYYSYYEIKHYAV